MRFTILQGAALLAANASVRADTDTDASATATATSSSITNTTAPASSASGVFTTVFAESVSSSSSSSTATETEQFTTVAAAASTTTCAAQLILDTCLNTTESYVNLCAATDYQCLCDKYIAIAICFDNCPEDIRAPSYKVQRDSYCQTARLFATTSSNMTLVRTPWATPTSAATTSADTTSTSVVVESVDVSATAAAANAAATESGNDAQERIARVGGILAGVAGFFAIFL
ncbi:hypothetical protein F5B19DRAFT_164225 [Rostrohypoxylon terebratum]|nr:hypothetical protein F5B19DRAFT_164225 [Rostrohypoxylon terebratum]